MGIGGQTEEDDVLLYGGGFERHRRYIWCGAALPDGECMALVQQVFHRTTHFAVAEDQDSIIICIIFHRQDAKVARSIYKL
jgi:hypothetical protein